MTWYSQDRCRGETLCILRSFVTYLDGAVLHFAGSNLWYSLLRSGGMLAVSHLESATTEYEPFTSVPHSRRAQRNAHVSICKAREHLQETCMCCQTVRGLAALL